MYLAAIIDWHSRAILAWKLSNCMDTALVTDVLKEAIEHFGKPEIFNTDYEEAMGLRIPWGRTSST